MASTPSVVLCAVVGLTYWTALGYLIARRLAPGALALPMAPMLGWAVHGAASLALFLVLPFSVVTVAMVAGLLLVMAVLALRITPYPDEPGDSQYVPAWTYVPAGLLAMVPAAAVLPKPYGSAVYLAAPIFDHAKVAIIDDIAKFGVPAGNPFFGEAGEAARLVYYYLWHFTAAQIAAVSGAGGWEADAALTWFTAFASLALMMGLAVWCCRRSGAAVMVVLLCAAGSGRPLLWGLFGSGIEDTVIGRAAGFAGWLFQTAWAPQHTAAASCAVLAALLMSRLAHGRTALLVATLALVVAAGFESSTWIGGVMFAVAAPAAALAIVSGVGLRKSWPFMVGVVMAAVAAACLSTPFVRDQLIATAQRGGGSPIAFGPYPVLGDYFSDQVRRLLDPAAFWLVLLVVEFPAIYPAGIAALVGRLANRDAVPERSRVVRAFAALTAASLGVSWLLSSTLADNNDLGWRAVLPGVMVLTVFAAGGLATWIAQRKRLVASVAMAAIAAGLPDGLELIRSDIAGYRQSEGEAFAATPELWAAVRRHAAPDERVANNPLFMGEMTPWPVNMSWALLAKRRSCYAGRELTLAYAPLSRQRRDEIDAQFIRVFAGEGSPDDIAALATRYGCRVVVVAASDGAWNNDPFAASPLYRLAEERPGRWRIYRAIETPK